MKKFFDLEGPVMSGLSVAGDLLILNLLAMICCLPVFTAGAAITALFDQCIHLVRGEDSSVARNFFRSFASNFKKSTILWLMILFAALLLGFDYVAALSYAPLFRVGIAAIALLVLAVSLYAFALLSRYENTLRGTLKNAASLAVAFFPQTLGMMSFTLALWLAGFRFVQFGAPVLLMFGLSLPCYVCSMFLKSVFARIDK